uniref:Uncharacterized protein n=1 Tax=Candidatus Kentrum sp. UNK TaxID=2126344 RepID=A0A451A784_9GAMM|nr:MAG: hypothetical protein BECKUNK1418G_GA0071005_10206 [Candidatus Kentron sp. UNK]VFK70045.1 MAG: hypothetical protein BECKUNK1418H_GA0071006_10236 [Candidatus Kentron sp. UNK]
MRQVFPLDPIIHLSEETRPKLKPGQVLVRINPKSGEIVPNKSLWPIRGVRSYVVTALTRAEHVVESETPVIFLRGFRYGVTLPLIVKYETNCPEGNQEQIAKALSREETPQESLEGKIDEIVQRYATENREEFAGELGKILLEMAQHLRREIQTSTGLYFDPNIKLQHQNDLTTHRITNKTVRVRTKDGREREFKLQLSADLEVIDEYEAALRFPEREAMENQLLETVERFCETELETRDLFKKETEQSEQWERLQKYLDSVLSSDSRRVSRLHIKPDLDDLKIQPFQEIAFDYPHTPHLSMEKIIIRNKIQLELDDAGKYLALGKPDLKDWAEKTLTALFQRELFEWTYLNFLLDFDGLKAKIKAAMEDSAREIGYREKQLITEPDLKENQLRYPSTYRFDYEGLYTKQPDVQVNLQVSTVFRIEKLEQIKGLLDRNLDVVVAIEESIRREIELYLHKIDPETVYMRFYVAGGENDRSLKEELESRVKNHLTGKEYDATVESVTVVPLNTEITEHMEKILHKLQDFRLKIIPRDYDGMIEFAGQISVDSVNPTGWHRFRRCDFSLNDILAFAEKSLTTELSEWEGAGLDSSGPKHRNFLEEQANRAVQVPVASQYGVRVEIKNFRSLAREGNAEYAKLRDEERIKTIERRRKRLEKTGELEDIRLDKALEKARHGMDQLEKLHEADLQLIIATDKTEEAERQTLNTRRDALLSDIPDLEFREDELDGRKKEFDLNKFRKSVAKDSRPLLSEIQEERRKALPNSPSDTAPNDTGQSEVREHRPEKPVSGVILPKEENDQLPRKARQPGSAKGQIKMAPDFDAPLEEFQEE